jgi:hypothetical protein
MTHYSISRDPPACCLSSIHSHRSTAEAACLPGQSRPTLPARSKLLSTQMHSMGSKWPSQCRTWREGVSSVTANHQYHQQITNITRTAQEYQAIDDTKAAAELPVRPFSPADDLQQAPWLAIRPRHLPPLHSWRPSSTQQHRQAVALLSVQRSTLPRPAWVRHMDAV